MAVRIGMLLNRSFRAILGAIVSVVGALSATAQQAEPTRPYLVVANQRTRSATMVELSTGRVSHVALGFNPHEVAISPDGRIAALTVPSVGGTSAGGRVIVLELATAMARRALELRGYHSPHGIAFVSDSVMLVGTLAGTHVVYVDARNGRVIRAVDGLPEHPYVVKLTGTGRAYVSSPHSSKVSEVDAAGRLVRVLDIPNDPAGIAVSADGKELYAAVWTPRGGSGITIYDLERSRVAATLTANMPRRIALTPDERFVVVSDNDGVRIVERATRQLRTIEIGRQANGSGVACAPDSRRCYVSFSGTGEIVEVDVVAGTVLRRFRAERGVDGVAYVR